MTQTKQSKKTGANTFQPAVSDQIYTLETAARVMDCSERALVDKFRSGEIQAKKRLKRWYVTHSNLLSYINP